MAIRVIWGGKIRNWIKYYQLSYVAIIKDDQVLLKNQIKLQADTMLGPAPSLLP